MGGGIGAGWAAPAWAAPAMGGAGMGGGGMGQNRHAREHARRHGRHARCMGGAGAAVRGARRRQRGAPRRTAPSGDLLAMLNKSALSSMPPTMAGRRAAASRSRASRRRWGSHGVSRACRRRLGRRRAGRGAGGALGGHATACCSAWRMAAPAVGRAARRARPWFASPRRRRARPRRRARGRAAGRARRGGGRLARAQAAAAINHACPGRRHGGGRGRRMTRRAPRARGCRPSTSTDFPALGGPGSSSRRARCRA